VWDAQRGYCTHVLRGHEAPVLALLFRSSPGAKKHSLLLFTASDDCTVRAWDLSGGGACASVLSAHFSAVTSLSLSPDNGVLLSGGRDKVVTLWSLRADGQDSTSPPPFSKAAQVPVFESVEGLACLPAVTRAGVTPAKGVRFAVVGEKGTLSVWTSSGGKKLFSTSPDAAAAAGEAGFTSLQLLPPSPSQISTSVSTSGGPAPLRLAASTSDSRLLFFDLDSGEAGKETARLVRTLLGSLDTVVDIRFLHPPADGGQPHTLAVATNSAVIRLLSSLDLSCHASLCGHSDTVLAIDALELSSRSNSNSSTNSTGEGALLASGGKDRSLRLWHVPAPGAVESRIIEIEASPRCLGAAEGHVGSLSALCFAPSPVAQRSKPNCPLLILTGGADKLLKLWDAQKCLAALPLPPSDPSAPHPEPGASGLAVIAAVAAHDKELSGLAASPDGSFAASASADKTVKLWRLPQLILAATLRGHTRGVWCVAFSPVDAVLASSSADKSVRLWSVPSGECLRAFQGHSGPVLKLAWLSMGTQLVSAGGEGSLKLWSLSQGEVKWTPASADCHDDKVWALSASPSGAHIASGGADGAVRIWSDDTGERRMQQARAEDETLEAEQALSTAIRRGDVKRALGLALRLGRPGALHSLLSSPAVASISTPGSDSGSRAAAALRSAFAALSPQSLGALLNLCAEWNANAKTCDVAQRALAALFSSVPPARLAALPGVTAALAGLKAYSLRHFSRLDRLARSSYVLDFTLQQAGALPPLPGADVEIEKEKVEKLY
jgi:U3 small nucleolar RNA-associated protein 13